jgi:hypothetical protein
MTMKLIIISWITVLLTACLTKTRSSYNSKLTIRHRIGYLTGIDLDTAKFTVLTDSINNTDGAFDLDYAWYINILFDKVYFESLKKTISSSPNLAPGKNEFEINWSAIDTQRIRGIWYSDSAFFRFVQKPKKFNPEPIYLWVDTLARTLNLELIHL